MRGTLACAKCATETYWSCETAGGQFVADHIPSATQPPNRDFDAWSHIGHASTHVASVLLNPWSGMLQGAADYLRSRARAKYTHPDLARRLIMVIDEWDSQRPKPRSLRPRPSGRNR